MLTLCVLVVQQHGIVTLRTMLVNICLLSLYIFLFVYQYTLADCDVKISMRDWRRAYKYTISCYTQKLAKVLFGNEVLARSTVVRLKPGKTLLDNTKVEAIISMELSYMLAI